MWQPCLPHAGAQPLASRPSRKALRRRKTKTSTKERRATKRSSELSRPGPTTFIQRVPRPHFDAPRSLLLTHLILSFHKPLPSTPFYLTHCCCCFTHLPHLCSHLQLAVLSNDRCAPWLFEQRPPEGRECSGLSGRDGGLLRVGVGGAWQCDSTD